MRNRPREAVNWAKIFKSLLELGVSPESISNMTLGQLLNLDTEKQQVNLSRNEVNTIIKKWREQNGIDK